MIVTEAIYDVRESHNCAWTFETHFIKSAITCYVFGPRSAEKSLAVPYSTYWVYEKIGRSRNPVPKLSFMTVNAVHGRNRELFATIAANIKPGSTNR